jgi:hypothetical protein
MFNLSVRALRFRLDRAVGAGVSSTPFENVFATRFDRRATMTPLLHH